MGVPDGRSQTLNTPLSELIPLRAQRTARLLTLPLVFINNCAALSPPTRDEHDVVADPAPNIVRTEDAVAGPAQNACAVRMLLPLQPEHVPAMVTLLSLVVPQSLRPFTTGDLAKTTFPDPVVPDIWEATIWPLLLPSGIPAHAPGVPSATLTQAATPLAVALEFSSISPCDHASADGAVADLVGNCISNPRTGALNVRGTGLEIVPTPPFTLTNTAAGFNALIPAICLRVTDPTEMNWP